MIRPSLDPIKALYSRGDSGNLTLYIGLRIKEAERESATRGVCLLGFSMQLWEGFLGVDITMV